MKNELLQLLPTLLPLAEVWVARQETRILVQGTPLSPVSLHDAKKIGVRFPGKIRLLRVAAIPLPEHPLLRDAALATNLISPRTGGMTVRYGIFIRADCWDDRRLIAHECAHTAQYERFAGIGPFLAEYLRQCIEVGYPAAPLEQEAVRAEKTVSQTPQIEANPA